LKELSSAFRKKYCTGRTSYSERYFTMEMKASESPLDFFYRLNTAAGKADIDFRKSPKRLEKHVRRFITKLRETRLKTSLQGQRFKTIANLEFALEQIEEVWIRSNQNPVTPKRDFRAENVPQGRFRQPPKRTGRAYVTRDEGAEEADTSKRTAGRISSVVAVWRLVIRRTCAVRFHARTVASYTSGTRVKIGRPWRTRRTAPVSRPYRLETVTLEFDNSGATPGNSAV